MGFQHMPEVVRKAAQAKGGRVRTNKGLAKVSPEKLKEITSLGGKAKHDHSNSRKGAEQTQVDSSDNMPKLENILGALDE